MVTFNDGPAKGANLILRSAPEKLTVVMDKNGKVDALDQPEDEIRPGERAFTYERVKVSGTVHVNAGRGRSGFYVIAEYKHVKE